MVHCRDDGVESRLSAAADPGLEGQTSDVCDGAAMSEARLEAKLRSKLEQRGKKHKAMRQEQKPIKDQMQVLIARNKFNQKLSEIEALKSEGYRFVTVSELLSMAD